MGKCHSKVSCKDAVLLTAVKGRGKRNTSQNGETGDDIIVQPTLAATKDNMLLLVSGKDAAALVAGVVENDQAENDITEHSSNVGENMSEDELEVARLPFPFCESIDNNSLFFRSFSSAVSGAAWEDESQVAQQSSQDDSASLYSMDYTWKQFVVDATKDLYIYLGILPNPRKDDFERNLHCETSDSNEDEVDDASPLTDSELDGEASNKKVQFSTVIDVIDVDDETPSCLPSCGAFNKFALNSVEKMISNVVKQNPQVPPMEASWIEILHREVARTHNGLLLADPARVKAIVPYSGAYGKSSIIPYAGAYEMTTKNPFYIWMDVSMFNQFAKENIDPFWFKETLSTAMREHGLNIYIKTPFEDPVSTEDSYAWGNVSSDRYMSKKFDQGANYSTISA